MIKIIIVIWCMLCYFLGVYVGWHLNKKGDKKMKLPLFASRNYSTDYSLELLLIHLISSRIESISRDDNFFNTIVFKNGTLCYWKCNWPYATFSKGTISIKTIDDKEITYKWNEAMPSKKLIKKLLAKIDNFIANNN